jgi:hypothetical protein
MNNFLTDTPTDRGLLNVKEQQNLVKAFTERLKKMNSEEEKKKSELSENAKQWNEDSLSIIDDKDEDDASIVKKKNDITVSKLRINILDDPDSGVNPEKESSAKNLLKTTTKHLNNLNSPIYIEKLAFKPLFSFFDKSPNKAVKWKRPLPERFDERQKTPINR